MQKFNVGTRNSDDRVTIDASIPVPCTLRGAGGNDTLFSGGGSDRISGDDGRLERPGQRVAMTADEEPQMDADEHG